MILDSIHIENLRSLYTQHQVPDQMWRPIWGDNKIPDLFNRRMQDLVQGKRFIYNISTIFACRIILDIQGILGESLLNCSKKVKYTIDVAEDVFTNFKSLSKHHTVDVDSISQDSLLRKILSAREFCGQGRTALLTKRTERLHQNLAAEHITY